MRAGEMGGRARSLSDYSTRAWIARSCVSDSRAGRRAGGCVSRRSQAPRHRLRRRRAMIAHSNHLDAHDSLPPRDSKWTHFGIPSEATTGTTVLNVLLPSPCLSLAVLVVYPSADRNHKYGRVELDGCEGLIALGMFSPLRKF